MHPTEALSNPTSVKRLLDLTPDGALTKLLGGKPRPLSVTKQRRVRQLAAAEVDQLVGDYFAGAGNVDELAKRVGVSPGTVSKHLKSRGLELGRLSLTTEEIRQSEMLRCEGRSFNAIRRELGRDPKTVKLALLG